MIHWLYLFLFTYFFEVTAPWSFFFLHNDLQKLTRGAGLSYANVAETIRVHREITCLKVHIAGRLSSTEDQGWIDTGGLLRVCEKFTLHEVGEQARGASLVRASGQGRAPLGGM